MYMKMLTNLSKKLATKFPVTTLNYSMVKIARCNDAFSDIKLEANPVDSQSLVHKDKKLRKRKGEKSLDQLQIVCFLLTKTSCNY